MAKLCFESEMGDEVLTQSKGGRLVRKFQETAGVYNSCMCGWNKESTRNE